MQAMFFLLNEIKCNMKLSIITPTFNRVKTLQTNFESVLCQTFKDIEHIIVDNLSTDGTEELMEKYKKRAPYPVIYIREKDSGIYNAMNKGLKIARGEWTHILNSDDFYSNNEVLANIFSKKIEDYDMISNAIYLVNQKLIWKPKYVYWLKHYDFPHPGMLLKKEIYKRYGYYSENYKCISDAVFQISTYPKLSYLIINEPLVNMAQTGISSRTTFPIFKEKIVCLMKFHKFPFWYKLYSIVIHIKNLFLDYLLYVG